MEFLKRVSQQITEFVKSLSVPKRIALAVTGIAVTVGMGVMFWWAGRTSYRPLMSNLNTADSAAIIRVLQDKKIPFRVDGSGRSIEIPPESVHDLRLELATMGLPQQSVVGYELFDKQALGTTSFVQKLNQKRALEGELTRTIGALKGVKQARVHLAIPPKSAFVEDQKKPTASVVLDLEPGTQLNDKQTFGIGTLIASAVEGLDIEDVVIVDSHGKKLTKNRRDPLVTMTADQMDFRQKLEEEMEKRVEGILAPIVGDGRVVARVTTELDFNQVQETQTTYDADGAAIHSTQKDDQSMEGSRPGPYGAAGAQSNQPEAQGANQGNIRTDTKKIRETINYDVPNTVRKVRKEVGTIKKLSVAVVVDGKLVKTQENGKVLSKSEPWPAERLKEFEQLVSSTVGFDKGRGDVLEIKNMEFTRENFEEAQRVMQEAERRSYLQNMIAYAVIGMVVVLFFLFVVRPYIKWVTENTIESVDTFLPQTIEELERLQKNQTLPGLEEAVPQLPDKVDPEKVEGEMLREKVTTLIEANPHKAALVLRDWLREGRGAAKSAPESGGKRTA